MVNNEIEKEFIKPSKLFLLSHFILHVLAVSYALFNS